MHRHCHKPFPILHLLLPIAILTGCGGAGSPSSTPAYRLTAADPGGSSSVARDVNSTGQVVGTDGSGAFVWDKGTSTLFGRGDAQAVNRDGMIVGAQGTVAYRWSRDGDSEPLAYGSAHGINDAGWVVGEAATVDGALHGFLWNGTGMVDLGTLGGNWSVAYDLTNEGVVVGWSETVTGTPRATLWRNGEPVDLGGSPGRPSMAYAVNEAEVAVGYAAAPDGTDHAHRFRADTPPVDLGSLGGYSVAYDVNRAGDTVGESQTLGGATRAVLWTAGEIVDLNDRIDPASGWLLVRALGINDQGQIVGQGIFEGRRRAFLLEP